MREGGCKFGGLPTRAPDLEGFITVLPIKIFHYPKSREKTGIVAFSERLFAVQ